MPTKHFCDDCEKEITLKTTRNMVSIYLYGDYPLKDMKMCYDCFKKHWKPITKNFTLDQNMLTKSDLKAIKKLVGESLNFALKNRPTNDDLKQFATKKDLIGLARGSEIDNLKATFLNNLEKWKNELYNKIDPILSRIKTAEEENAILRAKDEGRQEEREQLKTRLEKLEALHPNNRHATA